MFDLDDPGGRGGVDDAGDPAAALCGVEPDAMGTPEQRIAWVLTQHPCAATLAVLESLVEVVLQRRWRVLAAKAWERQRAAVTAYAAAARVTATALPAMSSCTQ